MFIIQWGILYGFIAGAIFYVIRIRKAMLFLYDPVKAEISEKNIFHFYECASAFFAFVFERSFQNKRPVLLPSPSLLPPP